MHHLGQHNIYGILIHRPQAANYAAVCRPAKVTRGRESIRSTCSAMWPSRGSPRPTGRLALGERGAERIEICVTMCSLMRILRKCARARFFFFVPSLSRGYRAPFVLRKLPFRFENLFPVLLTFDEQNFQNDLRLLLYW